MASLVRLEDFTEAQLVGELESFTREHLYDPLIALMQNESELDQPLVVEYFIINASYEENVLKNSF